MVASDGTDADDGEDPVEHEAAAWVARLSSSDATEDDRRAFEAWRGADPARAATYTTSPSESMYRGSSIASRMFSTKRYVSPPRRCWKGTSSSIVSPASKVRESPAMVRRPYTNTPVWE